MNAAARLFKSLLDLAGRRVTPETVAPGQPKPRYGMWLERDWDWHDANLYRRGTR